VTRRRWADSRLAVAVVALGRRRGGRRRRPYPRREDVANAILSVLARKPHIHPAELVDEVKAELENMGFYAGLVNAKRVWRTYEEYVRAGRMYDYLGVMGEETET
jgi:hypothetical protein